MIQSITIQNFRGIKHLDMSGFRKVNLLVGIERLFLDSAQREPVLDCVEKFVECLPQKPKEILKAKTQAYLSAQPNLVHRIGLAARNGDVNFDHVAFSELKTFLLEFKSPSLS